MANLTISLDDALIKRARVRAIEQGTSLSAKVREFLQGYVDASPPDIARQRAQATARLMAAIRTASVQAKGAAGGGNDGTATATKSGAATQRSLREEIYDGDFRAVHRQAMGSKPRKAPEGARPKAATGRTRSR